MQAPPFGTTCAVHPDTPASAMCSQCGRAVCNSCVVFDGSGAARCPTCAAPSASAGGGTVVPWERRAELGTMPAFMQTVKLALVRPADIFAPPGGPVQFGSALVFALICETIGGVFAALWQTLVTLVTSDGQIGSGETVVMGFVYVLAGPFVALWQMFVWGGLVHLGLLILSAGRNGFPATARVQGYVAASALLNVVPIVGGFIALVWGIVSQVIGLAAAHETSSGRTLGAVLAPILLCCGVAIAGALLMVLSVQY